LVLKFFYLYFSPWILKKIEKIIEKQRTREKYIGLPHSGHKNYCSWCQRISFNDGSSIDVFFPFILLDKVNRGWEVFQFHFVFLTNFGVFWVEKLIYWCCDVAVAQINYPSFKHNTQDSIEQVRSRSHKEDSSQIFILDDMQFKGGFERYLG
jgi:hypothetical protein